MIVYSADDSVFWGDMSMDKQATINQLITLKKDLETQRHEKDLLDRAISIRNSIQYTFRTRLDLFDETHKSAYISDMIGSEPIKPRGLIKLAVPVYLVKKSNYDKAIVEYRKQYALAEKAYYFDNQSTRADLQETAEKEKREAIAAAEAEYQRSDLAYKETSSRVIANTIVSEKYKSIEIVTALIDYLRDGRADTLKEAINLWHDEERKRVEMERAEAHRAEMLRIEQERLEAAQEAAEYQRLAYYAAQDAADSAKEAAEEARRAANDVSYSVWNEQNNE